MSPGTAALLTVMTAATPPTPVFVDVSAAQGLLAEGARVLDARGGKARAPFLPGAVPTSWTDVRAGLLRVGRLGRPEEAREHYAGRGVDIERPVLVYGGADEGWGEEGRIWWDLRYLGHPQVFILNGGVKAWVQAGGRTAQTASGPLPGRFPALALRADLRTEHAELVEASESRTLLDARTPDEFGGATPFLSPRGGHIPGARNLHWKDLLAEDGRLRSEGDLRLVLGELEGSVAVYCTGGVRSAFVVAVLTHLGETAKNYDGSWWDWSAREELPVE